MVISFDVETTKAPKHFPWIPGSYLVCVCIAREDGTTKSWLLNHPENKVAHKQSLEELRYELDSASRIVAHNIKFDLLWLLAYGFDISLYKVYCTQVAEYLLRGQRGGRGELTLGTLSECYNIPDKIDKVKIFWESGYETDEIPANVLLPYCEQDCINTLSIYQRQVERISQLGLGKLTSLQMELSKVLAEIEYNGLRADRVLAKHYSEEYDERICDCDRRILSILESGFGDIPRDVFNINSGEHLSSALYGGRIRFDGIENVEKERKDGSVRCYTRKCTREGTLTGIGFLPTPNIACKKEGYYKTDLETLKQLKCKTKEQKELIQLLTDKSRMMKLKSTYFDGLTERMVPDGDSWFVHPSLNQTIARTGRLTSSNPNGQNFPRGGTGPVKELFITRYEEE